MGFLKVSMLQETERSRAHVRGFQCCCKIHTTVLPWQRGWWDVLKVLEHTCRANSQPLIHYCLSAQAKCKSFPTAGLCITYMVQSYQSAFLSLWYTFPPPLEHICIAQPGWIRHVRGVVWLPRFISRFFLTERVKRALVFIEKVVKALILHTRWKIRTGVGESGVKVSASLLTLIPSGKSHSLILPSPHVLTERW